MIVDWGALLLVAIVSVVAAAVTVTLFAVGVKLLSMPPVGAAEVGSPRDDETDDVSDASRPIAATIGGSVCFVLSALVVLFGVYLIIPAFHR